MKTTKNLLKKGFLTSILIFSFSNIYAQQSIEEVVVTATLTRVEKFGWRKNAENKSLLDVP